jgi:hypothetical protein
LDSSGRTEGLNQRYRRGRYRSLCGRLAIVEKAQHVSAEDWRHGVMLVLVLFDQVAQDIEVLLLVFASLVLIEQFVDRGDRPILFQFGSDRPQRNLADELEVAIAPDAARSFLGRLESSDVFVVPQPENQVFFHVPRL